MQVFRDFADHELNAERKPTVVAFGSFDGLHQGHRMLLARVREVAYANGWIPAVLTFENHPLSILAPPYCPKLLMTPQRKLGVLAQLGMRLAIVPRFTREISQMSARRFLHDILLQRLNMRHIVCGYDCRFGHKGAGDSELLASEGRRLGFGVEVFEAKRAGSIVVGSRGIREMLLQGQVESAMALLERPHELHARVIRGEQRGRTLGFPTANLEFDTDYQVPANGVYAIWADVKSHRYGGMINLGRRPTFGTLAFLPEAHLFGFDGEIYGEAMQVYFLARLRDERRFKSPMALKRQLEKDRKAAREAMRDTGLGREA